MQLRDAFFADFQGRKVTIIAPSRRIAASACRSLLFALSEQQGNDDTIIDASTWNYIDQQGKKHGPYPFSTMIKWAAKKAFPTDTLPIQHATLECWVPLWFLEELLDLHGLRHKPIKNRSISSDTSQSSFQETASHIKATKSEDTRAPALAGAQHPVVDDKVNEEEILMMDWEVTVQELNQLRQDNGVLHDPLMTAPSMHQRSLPDTHTAQRSHATGIPSLPLSTNSIEEAPDTMLIDFPELKEKLRHHRSPFLFQEFAQHTATATPATAPPAAHAQSEEGLAVIDPLDAAPMEYEYYDLASVIAPLESIHTALPLSSPPHLHQGALASARRAHSTLLRTDHQQQQQQQQHRCLRLFFIIDTNIFVSHTTLINRVFTEFLNYRPDIEVLCIVPWIVLNELDKLKDCANRRNDGSPEGESGKERRKMQADAARLALLRIRSMLLTRDGYMHVQTAAEHSKAIDAVQLPDVQSRELRNDDCVLQTCLYYQRFVVTAFEGAGHQATAMLLSNDRGLCTRALANGVKCFMASELPREARGVMEAAEEAMLIAQQWKTSNETGSVKGTVHDVKEVQNADRGHSQRNAASFDVPDGDERDRDGSAASVVAKLSLNASSSMHADGSLVGTKHAENDQYHAQDFVHDVELIIELSLAPAVKYIRQQDLGDLWIEMLESDLHPPWSASDVLKVISRHSSTYWEILKKPNDFDLVHKINRYISSKGRYGGIPMIDAIPTLVHTLLHQFQEKLPENTSKPSDRETIPEYIRREDVHSALQQGIDSVIELKHRAALLIHSETHSAS